MTNEERQYGYDEERRREELEPREYDGPRYGRWVRYREEPPPAPGQADPGHGWQQYVPERRSQRPPDLPSVRPPFEERRHLGYGREVYYGDPYQGDRQDRGRGYGELYGRRERDYGQRRRPLYDQPWEWRHRPGPEGDAGYGVEADVSSEPPPGPYVGLGPQGYRRSDERILDDLADRLSRNGWVDASDVRLEVIEGEVTLEGGVESRPVKHLVEDLAAEVTGVREVHNRLRVHRPSAETGEAESRERTASS